MFFVMDFIVIMVGLVALYEEEVIVGIFFLILGIAAMLQYLSGVHLII